ncbi:hypothetical protein [Limibacillus halophilus]|uniref:Uncharacterized protein n=1 Tax=Limibacillus halophilus TaxID=1579333 RepID=A0A839SUK3_9PROT|nr:hypothetical protein [Limibacillus halophilus]MBB3066008.1 hypothetical protein [Limibacillus halophilus]
MDGDPQVGYKLRADMDAQLGKLLLLINGGGAATIATLLTDTIREETLTVLNIAAVLALTCFLSGIVLNAFHQRWRRECNLAYDAEEKSSPPLAAQVAAGTASEPEVCIRNRRALWASLWAFASGGAAILVGAIGTMVARHEIDRSMPQMFDGMASIISAVVATAALLSTWYWWREKELRRDEVLKWADEAISVLRTLHLLCAVDVSKFTDENPSRKFLDVLFISSILIERGRLFFRNSNDGNQHGREKEKAYQGLRPEILDQLIIAHEIALRWGDADQETRSRMTVISERACRRFLSLAQEEVGRGRTASKYNKLGGDGVDLDALLLSVTDKELASQGM